LAQRSWALYSVDVSHARFIPPALATLRSSPPAGEHWQYEVKFDGFRAQLHKAGLAAALFGKNGGDLTRRFPTIAAAVLALPTRSCVIDGELIAAGAEGQPDFLALLHGRHVPVCVYAFDIMALDGSDLREQPLEKRRAQLKRLLARAKTDLVRYSDSFPVDAPYRSGARSGWIKGKTADWKEANRYRVKLFNAKR
jgi:bifunctional non-homologous end joining protein LigD